jgi:hypothetical protein
VGQRAVRSLYRTILGIVVGALVAAWLPFSILYINALSRHAVAAAKAGGAPQTAGAGGIQQNRSLAPITTRTS